MRLASPKSSVAFVRHAAGGSACQHRGGSKLTPDSASKTPESTPFKKAAVEMSSLPEPPLAAPPPSPTSLSLPLPLPPLPAAAACSAAEA